MKTHEPNRFRLGIDVGGTFTDLVLFEEATGALHLAKVLTSPSDPFASIVSGITDLLVQERTAKQVEYVIHATTLVGNAVIERRGTRTALVTTKGFKDVLTLGRETRYDIYDANLTFPKSLVARKDRVEVNERIGADGEVRIAIDQEEIEHLLVVLEAGSFESVSICFLHSYRNDIHERQLANAIRSRFPNVTISISSDVLPESGEYERMCATVINALVQPITSAYLRRMRSGLQAMGIGGELYYMSSSGGLLTEDSAVRYPVRMLESGPAAGVLGAIYCASMVGLKDVLSFDMGGTTAKACVVKDLAPSTTNEFEFARVQRLAKGSGLPVKLRAIELLEVGAGGGSIAWIDERGLISVGPQSAGAAPGPICYGLGGKQVTVTDANLLLGYLNPDYFLGGAMTLDVDAARAAIAELGSRVRIPTIQTAWGVHEIVTQNMANALRTHAIEKGVDYRRFALVAFGGAGPAHAYHIAHSLGISSVIFPWAAGVFSAVGLLTAPFRFDVARTFVMSVKEIDPARVEALYLEMESELRELLEKAGVSPDQVALERTVGCRYIGQESEVETRLLDGAGDPSTIEAEFSRSYERRYGWSLKSRAIEAATWRCSARGPLPHLQYTNASVLHGEAMKGVRPVYVSPEVGFIDCPVFNRYGLEVGFRVKGPALIEERECTILVGPNGQAYVDHYGNIVMQLTEGPVGRW